jgi:hypothetical protein
MITLAGVEYHLVGTGEQRWWHLEAKRLGGLEVDHQLVFGRRLHRQIGRLLALEDAIDIAGRATVLVDHIVPIGDKAAAGAPRARIAPPQASRGSDVRLFDNLSPSIHLGPQKGGKLIRRGADDYDTALFQLFSDC